MQQQCENQKMQQQIEKKIQDNIKTEAVKGEQPEDATTIRRNLKVVLKTLLFYAGRQVTVPFLIIQCL